MLSDYLELLTDYTGFSLIGLLITGCLVLLILLVLKRG